MVKFFFFFHNFEMRIRRHSLLCFKAHNIVLQIFFGFFHLVQLAECACQFFYPDRQRTKKRKTLGMFCFGGSEAAKRIFQLIRISFANVEHLSSNSAILLSFSFSATLSLPSAVAAYLKFSSLKMRRNSLVRKFQLVENFYKRV